MMWQTSNANKITNKTQKSEEHDVADVFTAVNQS